LLPMIQAADAAPTASICNRTVVPTFIAYAYVNTQSQQWEAEGWLYAQAGDCVSLKSSQTNVYYFFAESDSSDLVAKTLVPKGMWGSGDGKDAVNLCAPREKFHRFASVCNPSDPAYSFRTFTASGSGTFSYTLWSQEIENKVGSSIANLEDAGKL